MLPMASAGGPMDFVPRLDILPTSQRLLWDELGQVPPEFTLYGGTAIALHLGHRQSIDFDFFSPAVIDPHGVYESIEFLSGSQIIQQQKNTLTCLVSRDEPVKISFFGLPNIRPVKPPHVATDNHLKIASLIDLAGMKALAVQQRAEAKDYIDVDAIIRAGVGLPLALAAAQAIFGQKFNPQITLKALSYFDDGDLASLTAETRNRLVGAVALTDLGNLPTL
jgi:hypothetical protein